LRSRIVLYGSGSGSFAIAAFYPGLPRAERALLAGKSVRESFEAGRP
jgi:hypothetical protein